MGVVKVGVCMCVCGGGETLLDMASLFGLPLTAMLTN